MIQLIKYLTLLLATCILYSCSPSNKGAASTVNTRLHDIWVATSVYNQEIDRKDGLPRLEIFLKDKKILGNDGCNDYNAPILSVDHTLISFGDIVATKKMCPNMKITNSYQKALSEVHSYKLINRNLELLNAKNEVIVRFLKVD